MRISAPSPKPPHYAPRVRNIIHVYLNGGPSQVDTFDPKPMLTRLHGQPLPTGNLSTERATGAGDGFAVHVSATW
ncbi:MAG: DUF1501 domain-containing protein [Pirellulaceae bacterium]